eukprot:14422037-Ditylum_brightwellii.AAC.1
MEDESVSRMSNISILCLVRSSASSSGEQASEHWYGENQPVLFAHVQNTAFQNLDSAKVYHFYTISSYDLHQPTNGESGSKVN